MSRICLTPIFIEASLSTVNGQRSTVNGQRLTVNGQRSTFIGQRSSVNYPPLTIDLLSSHPFYEAYSRHIPSANHSQEGGDYHAPETRRGRDGIFARTPALSPSIWSHSYRRLPNQLGEMAQLDARRGRCYRLRTEPQERRGGA